jgi:hypothetical protein
MLSLEVVRIQEVFDPDPFPRCCLEFLGFLCGKILGRNIAFGYCAFERFSLLYLLVHTHWSILPLESNKYISSIGLRMGHLADNYDKDIYIYSW